MRLLLPGISGLALAAFLTGAQCSTGDDPGSRTGDAAATASGAAAPAGQARDQTSQSKIGKYLFNRTRWGVAETTRRKYYKDMSEAEIKKVMKRMSEDIGVKCVFCHNEKNYASEEKVEKDFGRAKIGLVRYLNDKYRPQGADWEYTCYTCHHGELFPPSVPPAGAGAGR